MLHVGNMEHILVAFLLFYKCFLILSLAVVVEFCIRWPAGRCIPSLDTPCHGAAHSRRAWSQSLTWTFT